MLNFNGITFGNGCIMVFLFQPSGVGNRIFCELFTPLVHHLVTMSYTCTSKTLLTFFTECVFKHCSCSILYNNNICFQPKTTYFSSPTKACFELFFCIIFHCGITRMLRKFITLTFLKYCHLSNWITRLYKYVVFSFSKLTF